MCWKQLLYGRQWHGNNHETGGQYPAWRGHEALAEAITLGEKAGIEKGLLLTILGQTAVLTPRPKSKLDHVSQEHYPTAFALSLMDKIWP